MKVADVERSDGNLRQLLASLAGAAAVILGLVIWYKLKVLALSSWWGVFSFFFMPTIIGVCTGLVMRWVGREGTFGLAGLAVIITVIVSVVGMGMQHWLNVNKLIQKLADVTYDETLEYAKLTAPISDEKKLRGVLGNNETAVVGRVAARKFSDSRKEFWFGRNYIHFHWLATRQIIISGQGGAERTIWEATKLMENGPFLDDAIRGLVTEPVLDEDVSNFQRLELPFLRQLVAGDIAREDFEAPLITAVRAKIDIASLPSRGFEPLTGGFLLLGCIAAYKLVRQPSENELI